MYTLHICIIYFLISNSVIFMFSAVNVSAGRNTDSNATLSKSVALDIATYGRPLANGFVFDGSYTIPL